MPADFVRQSNGLFSFRLTRRRTHQVVAEPDGLPCLGSASGQESAP